MALERPGFSRSRAFTLHHVILEAKREYRVGALFVDRDDGGVDSGRSNHMPRQEEREPVDKPWV